jgi:hypothetical protein
MSDYDLLHTLTLRLLDPRHRTSPAYPRSYPKGPPSLFVGTLPPELDVDIPIPDGSRILGTVHMDNP